VIYEGPHNFQGGYGHIFSLSRTHPIKFLQTILERGDRYLEIRFLLCERLDVVCFINNEDGIFQREGGLLMGKVLHQIVVGHKDQICLPCLVLLSIVRAVVLSFSQLPQVLNL
jgi:hypothetical protein